MLASVCDLGRRSLPRDSSRSQEGEGMRLKKNHKTEIRKREVHETFCIEPGCEFEGKRAAQGICHTVESATDTQYVKKVMAHGEKLLKEMRGVRYKNKARTKEQWIKYLEGYLVCTWANHWFGLDELIHLRAENAKLRVKLGKWK